MADCARGHGRVMRDGDTARVKQVVDAMLRMVKLDIAALDRAYHD